MLCEQGRFVFSTFTYISGYPIKRLVIILNISANEYLLIINIRKKGDGDGTKSIIDVPTTVDRGSA